MGGKMDYKYLIDLLDQKNYKIQTKKRKSHIIYQGSEQSHTYVLKEGIVKTSILQRDGRKFNLSYLKGPDIVSILKDEYSDTTDSPLSIRVESETASYYPVPRVEFWDIINENPKLQDFIKDYYRRNLNMAILRQRMMLMNGKIGAVSSFLYYMAREFGVEAQGGALIDLVITNDDLAAFCGISTPNSVNRILHKLKEEGIIQMEGKKILVRDQGYFKQYLI